MQPQKDIFLTFKHHTDVIVSSLQHRFFLSAFGSEMVIRSDRLNMLLLFIDTTLSKIKETMVDRTHKLLFT